MSQVMILHPNLLHMRSNLFKQPAGGGGGAGYPNTLNAAEPAGLQVVFFVNEMGIFIYCLALGIEQLAIGALFIAHKKYEIMPGTEFFQLWNAA